MNRITLSTSLCQPKFYSLFQNVLHKIFTNFQLRFINSRRNDKRLTHISFESLRSELLFGVAFMFISGHCSGQMLNNTIVMSGV